MLGICHLCGQHTELSFEHVPPRKAFNNSRVTQSDVKQMLDEGLIFATGSTRGTYEQRGAGSYTLCRSCNNYTGRWYASEYIKFSMQVDQQLRRSSDELLDVSVTVRPLSIYKQLLTMFCSANPEQFTAKNPILTRYLLNKEERSRPMNMSVYIGIYDLSHSHCYRQSGLTARLNLKNGSFDLISEVSFYPFQVVLAVDGGSPDSKLKKVDWFSESAWKEERTISLKLYRLESNTLLPGDYRTKNQILKRGLGR